RLRLGADLHASRKQHGGAAPGRSAFADHRFRRGGTADPERVEARRPQGNGSHGVRRADRRAHRTYFLSRLDPVTTRWIISAFVFALLLLLVSGWRYRGGDHAALSIGKIGRASCRER